MGLPEILKEPLTVYKVVYFHTKTKSQKNVQTETLPDDFGPDWELLTTFMSEYQSFSYRTGHTYLKSHWGRFSLSLALLFGISIEGSAFHSFISLNHALDVFARNRFRSPGTGVALVQCTVPAGSIFRRGKSQKWNFDGNHYAVSSDISFDKVLYHHKPNEPNRFVIESLEAWQSRMDRSYHNPYAMF